MTRRDDLAHVPVMLDEMLSHLACRPGGRYVDGTLGGGGYAEAVLRATAPDGELLGLDWDSEAIERTRLRLTGYRDRLELRHAPFDRIVEVLEPMGWHSVDGIVLDLGISSFQLDDAGRGFSFMHDGPLDMRMDRTALLTAADIVNEWPVADLGRVIRTYGEERHANRIAKAIAKRRQKRPFTATRDLAEWIAEIVPAGRDSRRIHPATRTFQALRIAVNGELESLERFLDKVLPNLKTGGRLCIVAFHSLEDRLVKRQFRDWARSCRCPSELPRCRCEGRPLVRLLTRKVQRPSSRETDRNPRARSARLRALERL